MRTRQNRFRSLKQDPWIVNSVCFPNGKQKAQTVDVLGHVKTLADGSLVRDVADGEVIIRAIFSTTAVQKFNEEQEDMDSTPLEWDHALLLVVHYHMEFRPHENLEQCEFLLHIDLFRLWDLQEGFERKRKLIFCKEDTRIQAKIKELWLEHQKEQTRRNNTATMSQNESMASVSLTQLLEEMAKQDSEIPVSQSREEDSTEGLPHSQKLSGIVVDVSRSNIKITRRALAGPSVLSKRQDLMRPFQVSELLISDDEHKKLSEIPEWKDGYIPVTSEIQNPDVVEAGKSTDSYVKHTLVDDMSSQETHAGHQSPGNKGKSSVSQKQSENQSKFEVAASSNVGCNSSQDAIPENPNRTVESSERNDNREEIPTQSTKTPIKNIPESQGFDTEYLSPNTGGKITESQGFTPCLSPDTDSGNEQAENHASNIQLPRRGSLDSCSKLSKESLKVITEEDAKEERRLERLATPSKTVKEMDIPANQQTNSVELSESLSEDHIQKIDVANQKRQREETPISSSQSDSENDSQIKRRRLTFSLIEKQSGDVKYSDNVCDNSVITSESQEVQSPGKSPSSNRKKSSKKTQRDHKTSPPHPDEACGECGMSASGQGVDVNSTEHIDVTSIPDTPVNDMGDISEVENSEKNKSLSNTITKLQKRLFEKEDDHVDIYSEMDKEDKNEELIVISSSESHEELSPRGSPSVLRKTQQETSEQDKWTSPPNSLPSYQPQSTHQHSKTLSSLSSPVVEKTQLLTSLTQITALTETGEKLLNLKFPGSLKAQIVDFYSSCR